MHQLEQDEVHPGEQGGEECRRRLVCRLEVRGLRCCQVATAPEGDSETTGQSRHHEEHQRLLRQEVRANVEELRRGLWRDSSATAREFAVSLERSWPEQSAPAHSLAETYYDCRFGRQELASTREQEIRRWLAELPPTVEVYEVGPRDGLQNEPRSLSVGDKVRLIEALLEAGLKHVEVTSFVSPRWIPQLADAEEVLERLGPREGVRFSALVPNRKGLERARACGIQEAAVFLSASETHSRRNINKSIAEAVATAREVTQAALDAGMRVRGYLSVVWGCPYEGEVPLARVVEICGELVEAGLFQLSLGDTIGIGTPEGTVLQIQGRNVFTRLDEAVLRRISDMTQGRYFNAQDRGELNQVYDELDRERTFEDQETEVTFAVTGIAALITLAAGGLGLLWFNRLP